MENIDPSIIQQYIDSYINSRADGTDSAIPTISVFPDSFIQLLSLATIIALVLAGLFLIFYIISMIRRWKVQSAVLDMHRDIKDIKQSLNSTKQAPPKIDKGTSKIA